MLLLNSSNTHFKIGDKKPGGFPTFGDLNGDNVCDIILGTRESGNLFFCKGASRR